MSKDAAATLGYQPWQFTSFDAPRTATLPTAGELERIHQQARDEGYAAGYQEGRAVAAGEAQRLAALVTALQTDLAQLDQTVADHLLALGLALARRVVGEALRVQPALVLEVVQDAMRCLPEFEQPVRVHLHPADAALVGEHLAGPAEAGGWQLVPDAALARGGCWLASATSVIDATLEARWARVLATLGQTDGWLT